MADTKAKFVHPQDLGLDFPIWTRDQQCAVARSLSGLPPKKVEQKKPLMTAEYKKYMQLKEKYGK
jgi:hypothetical protein